MSLYCPLPPFLPLFLSLSHALIELQEKRQVKPGLCRHLLSVLGGADQKEADFQQLD